MPKCPDFLHDPELDAEIKAMPKITIKDLFANMISPKEEIELAREFYDAKLKGFNIHPDAVPGFARGHRNVLIKAKKWTDEDQEFYEYIKSEYGKYIKDITKFEKGELQYNLC